MAQLDKYTFFDQSFLILISFFLLYIIHSRLFIPYIAIYLKIKTKLFFFLIKRTSFLLDLSNTIYILNIKISNIIFNFTYNKLIIINNYLIYFLKNKII
jgi:hypothetical protein